MNNYLTDRFPGTGGTLGPAPDDFFVEEIPLYTPGGSGEHLYLTVEKTGLTTFDLIRQTARQMNVAERDIGYAGLKDSRAVTRQTISVPGIRREEGLSLAIDGVKILDAQFHTNKLRPGHLAGNRFRIRLHQTCPDAEKRANDVLAVLKQHGVPNLFGRQRYGALGNSHDVGRALLQQDYAAAIREIIGDPALITHEGWRIAAEAYRAGNLQEAIRQLPRHCSNERRLLEQIARGKETSRAVQTMPRKLLRLYLSAFQSSMFDRMVVMRLNSLGKLWMGDLAYKHDNGACFLVEDPELEQARADTFAISPSGPLFGYKVRLAEGQAGLLEQALLDKEKLDLRSFRLGKGLSMEGARRPLRVPLAGVFIKKMDSDVLELSFQLPKGSFATAVLHEVIKDTSVNGRLTGGLQ